MQFAKYSNVKKIKKDETIHFNNLLNISIVNFHHMGKNNQGKTERIYIFLHSKISSMIVLFIQ